MLQNPEKKKPVLHSRYNPGGEAEKYLNSLSFRQNPRFFILIEPGRGYMIPLLRRQFPESKILVLHVQVQEEAAPPASSLAIWTPESGLPLQRFLEREIPDCEAAEIQIIEWRPALAAYGEGYLRLLSETVDFIKRIDASARTLRVFGERWFKNFFKILGIARRVVQIPEAFTDLPCIIAGAGPSLEEVLPLMRELRRETPLLILGVSSSVPALRAGGVEPDLIITTDGGGWALFHLYECLRPPSSPLSLAASLSAALPSQAGELPLLLISDGTLWQNLILQRLNLPFINLFQRGTVTASALDLALVLTKGNIFITGMDLSHRDLRTHARPYSFSRIFEEQSSRLNPLYAQLFTRSLGITAGGSHTIYASWFSRHLETCPKRIYSLGTNHQVFKDLPPWNGADWGSQGSPGLLGSNHEGAQRIEKSPGVSPPEPPSGSPDSPNPSFFSKKLTALQGSPPIQPLSVQTPPAHLVKRGVQILLQSLGDPQTAETIKQELAPALFPGEASITTQALYDRILRITQAYGGIG